MATLNVKSFPEELYEALRSRAEQEHRSLAQQVIHLLSQSLAEPSTHSILELEGLGKELWRGINVDEHIERERASWD